MLKFILLAEQNIPLTPNEIKEINELRLYTNTIGITIHGEFVELCRLSSSQLSITLKTRIMHNVIRITDSKLQELLEKDTQWIPDKGNFLLQMKDRQGVDVRVTASTKAPDWIRIQCPYLIMEGDIDIFEALLCLLEDAVAIKSSLFNILQNERVLTFKKEYYRNDISSISKLLILNITCIRSKNKEDDKKNEGRCKLYFQIVKSSKVVFSFYEDDLSNVIDVLQIIV